MLRLQVPLRIWIRADAKHNMCVLEQGRSMLDLACSGSTSNNCLNVLHSYISYPLSQDPDCPHLLGMSLNI